jgi:hypothetical protein
MRDEPATTETAGLEGKLVVTPDDVHVPNAPDTTMEPFADIAFSVTAYELGLLIRKMTSLVPPGKSALPGLSPPTNATTAGVNIVPVAADAEPDPDPFQRANAALEGTMTKIAIPTHFQGWLVMAFQSVRRGSDECPAPPHFPEFTTEACPSFRGVTSTRLLVRRVDDGDCGQALTVVLVGGRIDQGQRQS